MIECILALCVTVDENSLGPVRPGAIHPSDTITRFDPPEQYADIDGWLPAAFSPLPIHDPPPPPPPPAPEPAAESTPEPEPAPPASGNHASVWDRLADCESGNWLPGPTFEPGSARWGWGGPDPVPPWGTSIHHGGLQFLPSTWTAFKPDGYPAHAYNATREQQIAVAERVLAAQGWGAWPTCARHLGLR